MYIVFTESFEGAQVERWYYGRWADKNTANEVALDLGGQWPIYHCVCTAEEAVVLGVQNMHH